jgi:probable F420-dependent oxidoreductase
MKVDVLLGIEPEGSAERAVALAATGVDGLFTFENAHDVFFPLVMAATAAPGVDLMTNVAIGFPRSAVHLAHAAYDLQLLSNGRFRMGLGSQVRAHIERRYGATWSRPAARMREQVLAIKAVFAAWEGQAPLDFKGEFTSHTYMPPVFNPGPHPYGPPPVLVGALGPRMTEVAAEVADGLLVMPFNSSRHLAERTRPAIERGLARAGRSDGDLEVIGEVIVAMGSTDEEQAAALQGVRFLLAFYASTPAYRPVLEVEGWGDLQPRLQDMTRRGEWGAMPKEIDDSMVPTLAVAGTPEECAEQIVARFGGFADRVCTYFPGYPVTDAAIGELTAAIHRLSGESGSP